MSTTTYHGWLGDWSMGLVTAGDEDEARAEVSRLARAEGVCPACTRDPYAECPEDGGHFTGAVQLDKPCPGCLSMDWSHLDEEDEPDMCRPCYEHWCTL